MESNYGLYILGNQWNYCLEELLKDPDTRRATIAINQPFHKAQNPNDYPCTQYIQFFIRENRLHLCVNMRSNDAVFGFCNDVFTFSLFQQLMLNDLNHSFIDGCPIELKGIGKCIVIDLLIKYVCIIKKKKKNFFYIFV